MKNTSVILGLSASFLALAGCMDPDGTYNNTANGALIGAGVGAATGLLIADEDEDPVAAAVGGAIGGIAGGAIGAQLDAQEEALRNDLAGSGALIVNTGERLVVTLPEAITFPVDGTDVKPSMVSTLNALARNLNQYPDSAVQVVGHTDSTGDASYNQGLSERRAFSVANILINGGVSSSRVQTIGRGENSPIASNDTESGRQQNRRVEINIIPNI